MRCRREVFWRAGGQELAVGSERSLATLRELFCCSRISPQAGLLTAEHGKIERFGDRNRRERWWKKQFSRPIQLKPSALVPTPSVRGRKLHPHLFQEFVGQHLGSISRLLPRQSFILPHGKCSDAREDEHR